MQPNNNVPYNMTNNEYRKARKSMHHYIPFNPFKATVCTYGICMNIVIVYICICCVRVCMYVCMYVLLPLVYMYVCFCYVYTSD